MGLQLRHKHVKCQVHLYSVDIDHHKLGYRVPMRSARSCLQWTKKTYGKFGRRPWVSFDGPTFQTPRDGTVRRPRPHRPGASESSRRHFPSNFLELATSVSFWFRGELYHVHTCNCSQWMNQTSSIRNLENCQVFRSLLALLVASWRCFCCFQFLAFQCRIRWRCPMLWRSNASVPEGAALICIIWNPRSCARSVAIRDLLLPFKIPVEKKKSTIWISNRKNQQHFDGKMAPIFCFFCS